VLLDRVLDLYTTQIEGKGIEVRREYARDCPPLHSDPEYLYQAFGNLIANAVEAMETGGRLTVRLGWAHGLVWPSASGERPAPGVKVEVADTGKGISLAEADKVFNPFFTTKASGTGLGLSLTHKIIEDHGGQITFRSAPGAGTTFRVVFPAASTTTGMDGGESLNG